MRIHGYKPSVTRRTATGLAAFRATSCLVSGPATHASPGLVGAALVIDSVSITHLTSSDATLEAQIDTRGLATAYQFQMWSSPCSKHGHGCELIRNVPLPTNGLLFGSYTDQSVSLDLNSVGVTLGGEEYGYRITATNAAGSAEAQWQTITRAPNRKTERPTGSMASKGVPLSDQNITAKGYRQPVPLVDIVHILGVEFPAEWIRPASLLRRFEGAFLASLNRLFQLRANYALP
jgi:hypothetical protein